MERRRLGRSDLEVSVIGFGAWAIGSQWGPQDDGESLRALERALDLGVTFIDTALAYGEGRSERLVGQAVRGRRDQVVVATKVPPLNRIWGPPPGTPIREVFPPRHIVESCEKSLRHLGSDWVDLLQLHTWSAEWNATDDWYDAMLRLREQGKIRAIGISVSDGRSGEANASIAMGRLDAVQAVYNILAQEARRTLFPVAQAHGVGVIARVPLASGALTGKFRPDTTFPEGDWRRHAFQGARLTRVVERVEAVRREVGEELPMAVRALQFCLGEEAVATVIPGIRSVAQAEANLAAAQAPPLPEDLRRRLYALAEDEG
jgi:aryl-alcohol dehydrogenase-like predicted oxidoreductase